MFPTMIEINADGVSTLKGVEVQPVFTATRMGEGRQEITATIAVEILQAGGYGNVCGLVDGKTYDVV